MKHLFVDIFHNPTTCLNKMDKTIEIKKYIKMLVMLFVHHKIVQRLISRCRSNVDQSDWVPLDAVRM